jgi:hypothetical protein
MKATLLVLVVGGALTASLPARAQQRGRAAAAPQQPTRRYDTPQETEKKLYDLSVWTIQQQRIRSDRPIFDSVEYLQRVIEILDNRRPKTITLADFQSLDPNETDEFGRGPWLNVVILKLGLKYKEMSRTDEGGADIVVYRWTNPNGSTLDATFRNRRLVNTSQSGLK